MAIAIDASTPAVLASSAAWTSAQTTAAFSPPANALLVALVVGDGAASGATTAAVTDSLAGAWTLRKRQNTASTTAPTVGGTAEVWVKYQTAAQSNMTVSITGSGAPTTGYLLQVLV